MISHPALLGRTVEDREIELILARIERGKQVENLVGNLDRACVRPIDLVDNDNRLEPHLQGLRDYEFCLRQRAFGGVDQHQGTVHHIEDAFDLTAEVGVAGRIDDVDSRIFPDQRGGLGEDGDAALALEIV